MRRVTRRLTFQLTPLLDLLLIVVFAQFLDVRDKADNIEAGYASRIETAVNEREQIAIRFAEVQRELAAIERERADRMADPEQVERLNEQIAQLTMQLVDMNSELQLSQSQLETLARLARELFSLPDDVLDRILSEDRPEQVLESEQIREMLDRLRRSSASSVVLHLLTYAELEKRSDIWKIYIADNGLIHLATGDGARTFRSGSPEDFATQLFDAYKTLPQPKSLVILLVSYGDAQAGARYAVTKGLPLAASRMRDDSGGRSRFEYAIIGYRPDEAEFLDRSTR